MTEQAIPFKPCPFCGSEPNLDYLEVGCGYKQRVTHQVRCPTCGAQGGDFREGPDSEAEAKSKAIAAWNIRAYE